MNKKERLDFITIAQVFSMILIVLSHCVPDGINVPRWMYIGVPYMQEVGLVIFMVSSGFLVTYTNQLEKYGIMGFIRRRTIRLMIPYVAGSLLLLFPKYLLRTYVGNEVSLDIRKIICQLLTPRNGILPHLWFLFVLWILCIFTPCFLGIAKTIFMKFFVAVILLALALMPNLPEVIGLHDIQCYVFWFYMGLLFGDANFIRLDNLSKHTWITEVCQKLSKYTFTIYVLSLPIQNIVNILLNRIGVNVLLVYFAEFVVGMIAPVAMAQIVIKIDKMMGKKFLGYLLGL